jgi:hypothetical protein
MIVTTEDISGGRSIHFSYNAQAQSCAHAFHFLSYILTQEIKQ